MKRICRAILWSFCLLVLACDSGANSKTSGAAGAKGGKTGHIELIAAPKEEDIPAVVRSEMAKAPGKPLLVYVGAAWCEPCTRFHQAAAAGELDTALGGLRLLEFDFDRDHEALAKAGYSSKMIPLFAIPKADGSASGQAISGGIKGEGAVSELVPRLSGLLAHFPPSSP